MENKLSQLMELVGIEGLKSFVLDYAENHPQFKADLTSFIQENYVGEDEEDIDYRAEVEWAFDETRDEGDRWHSYEVTDWNAIYSNLDELFRQADILLEAGNAEAALGIGVQFFISLNETCKDTDYYDEDYDPDYSAEKAKALILKSIGAENVSTKARQEAFDVIGKLAKSNAIEYCNVSLTDLLAEMTIKTSSPEDALMAIDGLMAQRGVNHHYVEWKVELLRQLNRHAEAENTLKANLHLPEIRMAEVERAINEQRYDEAIELAEEGYKATKGQFVWGFSESKWLEKILQVYGLKGDKQGEADTLRRLFIVHGGSIDYYHQLKDRIPKSEWYTYLAAMLGETHISESFYDHNVKADIYVEEGDMQALFGYLSSLRSSRLDALCKYAYHLKDLYSDQLTGMYVAEIREYAAKNMGRDHYRRMANAMREMQKLKDGHESARRLADELRSKYSNRRAMKEELKEF